MELFHLSKIYPDGKNSSAITVKSEHAVTHAFEKHLMFYKRVLVYTKNNLHQCRHIVLGNIA